MKKGILVVSFGTSHLDTMKKTIDVIEKEIAEKFDGCRVYRAFTSGMIIRKLKRTENMDIDTVSEALKRMAADGMEDVIVQPVEDYKKSIHAVMAETELRDGEMLVLMGHGTDHHANSAYPTLEYTFHALGYNQVLVGTVESFPELKNVMAKLKIAEKKKVALMPFMLVAGDHAKNDMAGDEDSWKSGLEEEGYEVRVILKGLGEFEGIRKIFLEHIEEAAGQAADR